MPTHTTRMQITLNAEQTARLLEWAGKATEAEVEADCEPSGYMLEVAAGGAPSWAEAVGAGGVRDGWPEAQHDPLGLRREEEGLQGVAEPHLVAEARR